MIKLLLLNGFRSLVKQMPYSFVNILGLTIGVASVLVLVIWILVETSYDKFHKDGERLYRVGMIMKTPNKEINSAEINAPAGPEFKREFPVVENMVRFELDEQSVIYNDKTIRLRVLYTDSAFFDMFSFGLATFATQSRMKEKSIRKINGATISDIFRKFNFELLKWIIISFIIAAPVGYYFMNRWLLTFAYKTTIGMGLLISSGLLTLAIGLLTVS